MESLRQSDGICKCGTGMSGVSGGGLVGIVMERFMRSCDGKSIGRMLGFVVSPGGAVTRDEALRWGFSKEP